MTYGVAVTGLNDIVLQNIRSHVFCAVEARPAGKSMSLALMLMPQKLLDPIFPATLTSFCGCQWEVAYAVALDQRLCRESWLQVLWRR